MDDKEGMAICYDNIGGIFQEQGDFNKAIEFLNKALEIEKKMNLKRGITITSSNLAIIYLNLATNHKNTIIEKKYYTEAEKYAETAFNLAKEINILPQLSGSADILKDIYRKTGNFKKALEYSEVVIATKDSMFKQEKTKAIAEMESKYQSEKKQLEIDKLAKEKELQTSEMRKQRIIILFVICGLLFVLGFSIVLLRLFLQKKKANKLITEKNEALQIAYHEINIQKEEIIVQRDSIQEQKEIIEEHQKEIEDSINYAKRIQQAVLPELGLLLPTGNQPCLPAGRYSVNGNQSSDYRLPITGYFVLFKPKDIVSGDFYWATKINDILIITVADCTGHGVPGAFMSMLGISFLNEIVRKKEITKASEVLDELRTSVIDALKQKGESGEHLSTELRVQDGMDIALCAINMNTLEMQFAGANNPCYIVSSFKFDVLSSENNFQLPTSDFRLIELKGDKQPIGIHSNMQPFTNQIYELHKGDSIYLMSDGYEDQFGGPNRKKFLSKNLKQLITANCRLPLSDQKNILETTINEWIGNGEQIDDITILGIKI